jgi:polar amino acid transport system substrate-binding protein
MTRTLAQPLRFALFLALALASWPSRGADTQATLTVATRHVPPFAIQEADGSWRGISIELWHALAERLGLSYRFQAMGLQEMLDAVADGRVDAAVAALTVTAGRERQMDFTHPYLTSGLGIAVPEDAHGGWMALTERLVSGSFLKLIAGLLALLLVVGLLVWLFERRRNQQFGGTASQGIGSGLWWSAVTMTTVGYGDKAPLTVGGRAVALVWMFASVVFISSFTAAIATALTVGEMDGKIRDRNDLGRARVATVSGSTSAQYLGGRVRDLLERPGLPEVLDDLASGQADAAVYDAPILRYQVRLGHGGTLRVLPGSFERQDYGIALPTNSPLREPLNRELLAQLHKPAWEELLSRYLGQRD